MSMQVDVLTRRIIRSRCWQSQLTIRLTHSQGFHGETLHTLLQVVATAWTADDPSARSPTSTFDDDTNLNRFIVVVGSLEEPRTPRYTLLGFVAIKLLDWLLSHSSDQMDTVWEIPTLDIFVKDTKNRAGLVGMTGRSSVQMNSSNITSLVNTTSASIYTRNALASANRADEFPITYRDLRLGSAISPIIFLELIYRSLQDYVWTKEHTTQALKLFGRRLVAIETATKGGFTLWIRIMALTQFSRRIQMGDIERSLRGILSNPRITDNEFLVNVYLDNSPAEATPRIDPFLQIWITHDNPTKDVSQSNTIWPSENPSISAKKNNRTRSDESDMGSGAHLHVLSAISNVQEVQWQCIHR